MNETSSLPAVLADASVHAVDLTTGQEMARTADVPWALASVVKLPWAVAAQRAIDRHELSATERLTIDPRTATPGPTGISALRDAVEVSVRDALALSLGHSDNASADAVVARLGLDTVRADLVAAGLPAAMARRPIAQVYTELAARFAGDSHAQVGQLARLDDDRLARLDAYDPALANAATARELTSLVRRVWAGDVASARGCGEIRDALLRPAAPGRIARGFGSDDVVVAGKTGTLLTLRHEAAWVGLPDGQTYAVAVLSRARRLGTEREHDAAVGALAVRAIQALRRA